MPGADLTADEFAASPTTLTVNEPEVLPDVLGFDERVELAAQPENNGPGYRAADYLKIVIATVIAPAAMCVAAWFVA